MHTIAIVVSIAVLLLVLFLSFSRMEAARCLVSKWAKTKGFELMRLERRDFFRGPFFWSGKHQFVYYLVVMDRGGHRRKGYVRVGSFWLGSLTPETVRVQWVR